MAPVSITIHRRNGYSCNCAPGFAGSRCQLDQRPCQPTTCWNNGESSLLSDGSSSFSIFVTKARATRRPIGPSVARVLLAWRGVHCETSIDACANVSCQNSGVCRSSLLNYTCQCLGVSYSGRHCEIKATATAVKQAVSRSFAFVGIVALVTVLTFIVTMDVLKYGFGVDPVDLPAERARRGRQGQNGKRRPRTIVRFLYVDAPGGTPWFDPEPVETIDEE